jgi:excisionase family DNA binding protein
MHTDVPIFHDTQSAATLLGVSASSLEKWRVHGTGPAYRKHGRSVRYLRADLDAWSARQARTSTSEAA